MVHPATTDGANTARKPKSHARRARHTGNHSRLADFGLTEMASNAADGLATQFATLQEKGLEGAKVVERRIVANPKSSVLIALAVGYAWGRLRKWL